MFKLEHETKVTDHVVHLPYLISITDQQCLYVWNIDTGKCIHIHNGLEGFMEKLGKNERETVEAQERRLEDEAHYHKYIYRRVPLTFKAVKAWFKLKEIKKVRKQKLKDYWIRSTQPEFGKDDPFYDLGAKSK